VNRGAERTKPAKQARVAARSVTVHGKKTAYGGVLIDQKGRVLLRKPKVEYDGYVWTFPKGKAW
jgi:hypothetical protein